MPESLILEDLDSILPAITPVGSAYFQENCVVCFDHQGHASGVTLDLKANGSEIPVQIYWARLVTDQMRTAYADQNQRVGIGACAVGLLIVSNFTEYDAVTPSATGNGIDYHLVKRTSKSDLIFNESAMLEVSGIQASNSSNSVESRINEKRRRLRRIRGSSTSITPDPPTLICVVDFGRPASTLVVI